VGQLVDGGWTNEWYDTAKTGGKFVRGESAFRNWITADGRRKLAGAGIAPPHRAPARCGPTPLNLGLTRRTVHCPQCGSANTRRSADFGSTACKALYRCADCSEPFEYVKEI